MFKDALPNPRVASVLRGVDGRLYSWGLRGWGAVGPYRRLGLGSSHHSWTQLHGRTPNIAGSLHHLYKEMFGPTTNTAAMLMQPA